MKKTIINIRSAKYFKLMCVLYILCLGYSCSDDVLDITPKDRFSDNEVWQDEELMESFVNNTYYVMPHGFLYPFSYNLSIYNDEAHYRTGGADYINDGNISEDNLYNINRWTGNQNYWDVVTKANIFLKNVVDSEVEQELRDRMTGEIKVLRALAYLMLNQMWGGVPLITEPFGLDSEFKVPRNTYDECMSFIISELDGAIPLLPLSYGEDQTGRVTKGAAMAIKSRATLYWASPLVNTENDPSRWQAAADAAKAVIDLGIYSLYPDYRELFLKENSYNSEIIWSLPFNYPVSRLRVFVELMCYPIGYGGFGQATPLHNVIKDYETVNGLLPENDPEFDPQNPYVNRDPRFDATIFYDGQMFQGREVETFLPGGIDSQEGPMSPRNATKTGYYLKKFCDLSVVNPNTVVQGNSPYILSRYAEILLNYSEAMYQLGNEDASREYLNKVRSRTSVDMPSVTDSGDELWKRIINERRIELAFEEQRYFDVRRWLIAPEVLSEDGERIDITKDLDTGKKTYTVTAFNPRSFNERNYWLPIPIEEIEKNENLEQNPGY